MWDECVGSINVRNFPAQYCLVYVEMIVDGVVIV